MASREQIARAFDVFVNTLWKEIEDRDGVIYVSPFDPTKYVIDDREVDLRSAFEVAAKEL